MIILIIKQLKLLFSQNKGDMRIVLAIIAFAIALLLFIIYTWSNVEKAVDATKLTDRGGVI